MNCPECKTDMIVKLPVSSEPEGFRPDIFCPSCNIRFMVTKGAIRQIAVLSKGKVCPHCEGTGRLDGDG